jgi:hypothetical protein
MVLNDDSIKKPKENQINKDIFNVSLDDSQYLDIQDAPDSKTKQLNPHSHGILQSHLIDIARRKQSSIILNSIQKKEAKLDQQIKSEIKKEH